MSTSTTCGEIAHPVRYWHIISLLRGGIPRLEFHPVFGVHVRDLRKRERDWPRAEPPTATIYNN